MTIDAASRATGLSRDMIRHYEKLGLVCPERQANGYRDYSDDDLYLLTVVKYLSNLGVPLKGIARSFESGRADLLLNDLRGEIDRLTTLKAQIDARIAAARDSVACFEQLSGGVAWEFYDAGPRCLLPCDMDRGPLLSRRTVCKHGGFFQFYYRQRYRVGARAEELGTADRGLMLYDLLPGAERIPAQRCLRAVLTLPPGRLLQAHELEEPLRRAAQITGRDAFTALISQIFQQRGARDAVVLRAELLLGGERDESTEEG